MVLVNKPTGWTSFDVVNFVRSQKAKKENLKPKQIKVGHSGTLDPFASGLLIILIGKSNTKTASIYSKLPKTYKVTAILGQISTTGDPEGNISKISSKKPALNDVLEVLKSFKGEIEQVPPIYSAIKVNGKRAYKLARAGNEFSLKPRKVNIMDLDLLSYDYPEITFTTKVSSGTYIRSLVMDIGEKLGTGAYTSNLIRTKIGEYKLKDSIDVRALI